MPLENDASFFPESKLFRNDLLTIDRILLQWSRVLAVGDPSFNERRGPEKREKKNTNERKICGREIPVEGIKTLAYSTARLATVSKTKGGEVLNLEIKISIPLPRGAKLVQWNERGMMHLVRRWCTVHAKWENFVDLNKKDNKEGLANLILVNEPLHL